VLSPCGNGGRTKPVDLVHDGPQGLQPALALAQPLQDGALGGGQPVLDEQMTMLE
jgi:hypothetical protein